MSTSYVLIVFAICIIAMILMITKAKVNAAFSILLTGIVLAIALKTPWESIESTINNGFSNTIRSVAIVIFLGCFLSKVMEETGAAVKITESMVSYFGEKNIEWAIALSSFILGIAIWGDTVVVLLIPIVSTLALKTKKSMVSIGSLTYIGALVTASLVPPTPGPVAAAALLEVPIGQSILWGLAISIPSVIAATIYLKTIKEPLLPKQEFVKAAEEAAKNRENLPSLFNSLAPLSLAIILIMINTFLNLIIPGTEIANFFKFLGSPLTALLAACIYSLTLTGKNWKTKTVLNSWVDSAMISAAMPIIVTGMGGVLAILVRNSGVTDSVAAAIVDAGIPGIIIPIIIAAIIHIVTGSNALGVMTAAALVQPLLGTIGVSPLAAFLACGTGALMFKHGNSSGFWVAVSMSNMDIRQGMKGVSIASTIAGGVGAVITIIISMLGII